jgi:TolA-binding protein
VDIWSLLYGSKYHQFFILQRYLRESSNITGKTLTERIQQHHQQQAKQQTQKQLQTIQEIERLLHFLIPEIQQEIGFYFHQLHESFQVLTLPQQAATSLSSQPTIHHFSQEVQKENTDSLRIKETSHLEIKASTMEATESIDIDYSKIEWEDDEYPFFAENDGDEDLQYAPTFATSDMVSAISIYVYFV